MNTGFVFGFKWLLMLSILFCIILILYKFIKALIINIRNNAWKPMLIKVGIVFMAIFLIKCWLYSFNANRLPLSPKYNKEYIMDLKEVKETSNGTKVKLNKAFLDLNYISFNIGIKGKDKLVAVEVKKNLQDKESLREITGLWVGDSIFYEFNGSGASYKSDNFIDNLYVVCYLSSGEDVSFKIEDKNNIKDKTEIIPINQDVDYNGQKIRFRTLSRGINYTDLYVVSDVNLFNLKMEIIQDKKVIASSGSDGSGGMIHFSFDPIGAKDITIKCSVKNTDKEFIIKVR